MTAPNARAVAAWSAAVLLAVLITNNPAYRVLIAALTVLVVVRSAGWSRTAGPLRAAGLLLMTTAALNLLLSHVGDDVFLALPGWFPVIGGPLTLEALFFGLNAGLAIAVAVLAACPLWLLLQPSELVNALPSALNRTGAAVGASLNLVPATARSFVAVREAERSRGWRLRGPRSWTDILVPVLLTAMEDSIQLAESMEARAFGAGRRTSFKRVPAARADVIVLGASVVSAALFVAGRLAGAVPDWYPYPTPAVPDVGVLGVAASAVLVIPAFTWRSRPHTA